MDGVDQLNNILVIGMTNRRDMIDEALLRPGRMEVQMEIGLPDEKGRVQILKIHTSQMREHKKLAEDVNLETLAAQTKNFSGAEIEGLCRAAASSALNEKIKVRATIEKCFLFDLQSNVGWLCFLPFSSAKKSIWITMPSKR